MSKVRAGLYYSEDHEWLRVEGDCAYVGITDHAQDSLGDLVFADAEPEGSAVSAGEALGVVESVKAAADVNAPLDCEIVEINGDVLEDPAAVNADPYGSWLVKVRPADMAALEDLMDAGAYQSYIEGLR